MNTKRLISRVFSVLLVGVFMLAQVPAAQAASVSADGFNPGTDGTVYALAVQPDGKILVGGLFTTLAGQPRQNLGRLNPDGTLDTSFNPGADNTVYALAVQPDGKILVGGSFTQLGGSARNNIGRLNSDGSLDASVNPGANVTVYALAVQPDGKIVVGGSFTQLGGGVRNHLGRLNADGSLDTTLNPGADGTVYALAVQPDGKILVGGAFTHLGGGPSYIGRINPDDTLDTNFNPSLDGTVRALVVQPDGKVLVGGDFTSLNESTHNYIGRINTDSTVDINFDSGGSGANGPVYSLVAQPDGKILVGGAFTQLGGSARNYLGRFNLDGTLDAGFNPGASANEAAVVYALAVQPDGKIVVGGSFATLGGSTRNNIGRLYPDGSLDKNLNPAANDTIYALAIQPDGKILVGGAFTQLGGGSRSCIGRLNPDGSLDASFNPGIDGTVYAIAVQPDGNILVGGSFTTLAGQPRQNIGRLLPNGDPDLGFDPGANGTVYALALQPDGKILVGGAFTQLGGSTRNRIGRLTSGGALDAFDPGVGGTVVYAIAVQPDGKVLAGGTFTTLVGTARNNIGRLNANGTLDTFDPGANNTVYALAIQSNGKILAGGSFTQLGGGTRNRIGRLASDGALDTGFNPGTGSDGTIFALAIQSDGNLLVGGTFTTLAGQPRQNIGRFASGGSLDASFTPEASAAGGAAVYALAVQPDGKILVGGEFTTLGGSSRTRLGRLSSDTAALQDLSFNIQTAKLTWQRSGAGPEISYVTFELSTDSVSYSFLGMGTRIAGGWELTGLTTLPEFQNLYIRARGYTTSGNHNGSVSVVESVRNIYIDRTPPIVISSLRASPNPTNAPSVDFTVTFSEPVNGVGTADFALTKTGSVDGTISSLTRVNGSDTIYTVTVNSITGAGYLGLAMAGNATILDAYSNPLSSGGIAISETYEINRDALTVMSSLLVDRNPTNGSGGVDFMVTFSESVTGVNMVTPFPDFLPYSPDGVTGTVTGVAGSGDTYTVTVDSISSTGTLRLDVVTGGTIADASSNPLSAGYILGEFYTIDQTPPTVLSILRASGSRNPTNQPSVSFTVKFTEPVTGVDVTDFTLNPPPDGGIGASVASVSGSGATYTVRVNTGSGNDIYTALGLDLTDNDSIMDAVSNELGGVGLGNGNFTGETFTIDKTYPIVSSIQRVEANPTNLSSVHFTVTFSVPVTGVDTGDFALTTTDGVTGTLGTVTGSGTTYTVTVNSISGNGTLRLDVIDNDTIVRVSTSKYLVGIGTDDGSFSSGQTYTIDNSAPVVSSILRASPNPNTAASVDFAVTFSESVTGVGTGDFSVTTTGDVSGTITGVTGAGATYTVTVGSIVGSGTLRLDVIVEALSPIMDLRGNSFTAGFTGGQFYTVDRTPPAVSSSLRAIGSTNPSKAASLNFTVTFSASVTGVDASDFSPYTPDGVTGAAVHAVTGSGTTYTVTVYIDGGSGTLRLDVLNNGTILDAVKPALPLGSGYTGGDSYTVLPATFSDVPYNYAETVGGVIYRLHDHIQALYNGGFTAGCATNPTLRYCPTNTFTRVESAVFMLRGNFGGTYGTPANPLPPATGTLFSDMTNIAYWGTAWAEAMYGASLTAGCGTSPLRFCPSNNLTRVEASVFSLRLKYGVTYGTPANPLPPATGTMFADMTNPSYWGTAWAEQAYRDELLPACGTQDGKPMFCPTSLVNRAWAAYMIVKAKNLPMP